MTLLSSSEQVALIKERAGADIAAAPAPETTVLSDTPTNQWDTFNVALMDAAPKEGRPVVIDCTADWCINFRNTVTLRPEWLRN
ncbi:MAG TPA: hypothetical protein VM008_21945 [Phycisphaerae bacterium]|nr:hypothetical protein [Phycisphaerae bacterium]